MVLKCQPIHSYYGGENRLKRVHNEPNATDEKYGFKQKKNPENKSWNLSIWDKLNQTMWCAVEYKHITLPDDPEADTKEIHKLLNGSTK